MRACTYDSLGNTFLLLDYLDEKLAITLESGTIRSRIQQLCAPSGLGVDGILVLSKREAPTLFVYNADGSAGEMCLNGVRCAADYLYSSHKFPSTFEIMMSGKQISCHIQPNGAISTLIPAATYQKKHTFSVGDKTIHGHSVDVGNPHLVILEQCSSAWLRSHGSLIESHQLFPARTNVEFIWPLAKDHYAMRIYERGVGMTAACSSGAVAALTTLINQQQISYAQPIMLSMPGGDLRGIIHEDGSVLLEATAKKLADVTLQEPLF